LNAVVLVQDDFGDNKGGFTSDAVTPIYFSLITLATVGYGEFHPSTPICRALVAF